MIDVDFRVEVTDNRRRFSLDVRFAADAPVVVLYGESGAGKTLTLQTLAGLLRPRDGHIRFNGLPVFDSRVGIDLPASRRRVGYVFQNYALFPHLSVRDNIAFGLGQWWRRPDREAQQQVDAIMRALEIEPLARSSPQRLSGGQQQRVALARALVRQPEVLLLDEPFAALNPMLRVRLRTELQQIQQRFGVPMVLISHDIDDVAALADVMVVLDNGRVSREVDLRNQIVRERELAALTAAEPAGLSARRRWLASLLGRG
jgi:molybdate transport system ATP-binding protein